MAGASLLFAAPAQAYDVPGFEVPVASQAPAPFVERAVDAAGVLELWRTAGPATRAAAATALVGGPEALQAFLDGGQDVPLAADRKELVTELTERGSENVKESAVRILGMNDPAAIDSFLSQGWAKAWDLDLRITATRFLNYDGPIRTGASNSLDKGSEAVEQFVLEGWRKTAQGQDREAVTYLTNSPVPAVTLGAQAALDTYDPEAVASFLRYGQFAAAAQDTQKTTVGNLIKQVRADIAANPQGTAAVAERAGTAVEQARNTIAAERKTDLRRLLEERDLRFSQAWPKQAIDNAQLTSQEPAKAAFRKAADEIPGLLATLKSPGANLDLLVNEARQATLDLALVGTPKVRKAAGEALLGGNPAVKSFVTTGHADAAKQDSVVPSAFAADRQRVYQSLASGGTKVQSAAKAALGSSNHADVRYFLEYGLDAVLHEENKDLANTLIKLDSPELQTAAGVALASGRAELQKFAETERFAAEKQDAATAAHVASVDAMIAELAGLADKAAVDAGKAADAAKAAEGAPQARGGNLPMVDASQLTGIAPNGVPWPQTEVPPVALAVTGQAPDGSAEPTAELPEITDINVPPAGTWPEAAAAESLSQETASPLAASSTGLNGWTLGLIAVLVLAAAGAITFLLRRKGATPVPAKAPISTGAKPRS